MENQKDKEALLNNDREAFLLQHWNQNVFMVIESNGYYYKQCLEEDNIHEIYNRNNYHELKSLENISDEDAVAIAQILKSPIESHNTSEMGRKICKYALLRGFDIPGVTLFRNKIQEMIDYLRSKSYLIGFRNYSLEQILEMGWAKYE